MGFFLFFFIYLFIYFFLGGGCDSMDPKIPGNHTHTHTHTHTHKVGSHICGAYSVLFFCTDYFLKLEL